MKVLVAEDDAAVFEPLLAGLTRNGFEVRHVVYAAEVIDAIGDADLLLLDLGLPDGDGLQVLRELRRTSDVPVIIASARGDETDRIVGLELGADDYVVKPFSVRELAARIRAVARRRRFEPSLDAGRLVIDRSRRTVLLDGNRVELTAKEFDLLAFLANDIGAVHTRTEILENVWDAHWYGPTKTVDAHVASLRKKLGGHEWIQAVRGVGFRLEPPE